MSSSAMKPTNPLVTPMLTDMYQLSMTYAYWKNKRTDCYAVFDLFFRKNPFGGEFCVRIPALDCGVSLLY
jgi:nicotinate phosphoribosyltransferase